MPIKLNLCQEGPLPDVILFPPEKSLGVSWLSVRLGLLFIGLPQVEKEVILLSRKRCLCPASHGVPGTSLGRLNLTVPQNLFRA